MELLPSAHVDTFCRDHLPPAEQWPELVFDLPELALPRSAELRRRAAGRRGRPARRRPPVPARPRRRSLDVRRPAGRVRTGSPRCSVEDLGIVPGNRVLLRGPNNPWLAACWFGVLKAGAVVVTTMPLLRAGELSTIDEHRPARRSPCVMRASSRRSRSRRSAIRRGRPTARAATSSVDIDGRAGRLRRRRRPPPTTSRCSRSRPARPAGRRRRCTSTATCSRSPTPSRRHVLQPTPDDVFTGTPPLAFTFGLGGAAGLPAAGRRVDAADREGHARPSWRDLIDRAPGHGLLHRADGVQGDAGRRQPRLATLRRAVSAGEHLPAATWRGVKDATGVAHHRRHRRHRDAAHLHRGRRRRHPARARPASAVPGYQATGLDETGAARAGRSPRAARGEGTDRLPLPRTTRGSGTTSSDGWNITGDTFCRDEDGYFWYQARSDDMIISSGYNIAAPRGRGGAARAPRGRRSARVVGTPDEARG